MRAVALACLLGLTFYSSQAIALVCAEPVAPSAVLPVHLVFFFLLPFLMLLCGYGIKAVLFRKFLKGRFLDYFVKTALAPSAVVLVIIWAISSIVLDNPDRSFYFVFLSFTILFSVTEHAYFTKRGVEESLFRVRSVVSSIVLSLLLAAVCFAPYTAGTTGNCGAW